MPLLRSRKGERGLNWIADSVENSGVTASNYTMVTGGATGLLGWASQVNWIGWAGVLIALLGVAVNVYFNIRKEHRESRLAEERAARERELHALKVASLKDNCDLP